ncbi:MAG TPA: biopolymer transporter ExbD [Chthoniobacterales bacterium]|nr:biopolymer transporter ExbD [Chthoniobacterales bacterium]
MKMRSPIPKKHARIEIIPLIDIMFFLLASFMMVSLSQTHMKGIRVNLPSANSPPTDPTKKDYVAIRVTEGNLIYFDNVPVLSDDVLPKLFQLHEQNPEIKVSLSAEQLSLHGDVIAVLDKIRLAKITKIGYQIKTAAVQGAPGTVAPPGPAAPPPPPK